MLLKLLIFLMSISCSRNSIKYLKVSNPLGFGRDEFVQQMQNAGYKYEVHYVDTSDGYTLRMHRIPPKNPLKTQNKGIVFLMHGLASTSSNFIALGRKNAIAFLLSDIGYDVWMGNDRGSEVHVKHKRFPQNSKEFWKFSTHEVGLYDLSAMIDYTLFNTNQTSMDYIGHSQGTTALLVLLSIKPQYNSVIRQAHFLGPAAYQVHSPLTLSFTLMQYVPFMQIAGFKSAFPFRIVIQNSKINLCKLNNYICASIIFFLVGFNKDEPLMDLNIIPEFMSHIPGYLSERQLEHVQQFVTTNKFQWFDYGHNNIHHYGSHSPPQYELRNVRVPIYLYHLEADNIISLIDVKRMQQELPNVRLLRVVKNYNHLDCFLSRTAKKDLYIDIIKSMEEINT